MRTEAEVTANITRWNTVALRKLLEAKLDEEDLRNYVFELAIDYDDLRGATIADKVRELVSYLDHR